MAIAYYERLVQEDLDVGYNSVQKRNPGGGTLVGTQVGIHSFGVGQARVSTTWNPAEIANGAQVTTTVTVTGADLGDFVLASFGASLQGLRLSAYVSSANVVTVVLSNLTGAAVDLASDTLNVLVLKSR